MELSKLIIQNNRPKLHGQPGIRLVISCYTPEKFNIFGVPCQQSSEVFAHGFW